MNQISFLRNRFFFYHGKGIAQFQNIAMSVSLPYRFFISFIGFFLISLLVCPNGYCRGLKIKNLKENKDIDYAVGQVLYKSIFVQNSRKEKIYPALPLMRENMSTSLTGLMTQTQLNHDASSRTLDQIWSQMTDYLKKNFQNFILPTSQAVSFIPIHILKQHFFENINISPKIRMGKNFIQPSLGIKTEDALNTSISYHSRNKYLEAEISKDISQNLEFILNNTNLFSNTNEKRVTLGVKYKF